MKKIGASYVYWYNRKYGRIGHLFQDRYKSETIEDDVYFLTVWRYIHQNPLRVGLSIDNWTSYNEYNRKGRDEALQKMKGKGLSIRQIERITGINGGTILKACVSRELFA